ncbi:hypothetical protein V8C34DRAFT_291847 [Trichoderma compactum]
MSHRGLLFLPALFPFLSFSFSFWLPSSCSLFFPVSSFTWFSGVFGGVHCGGRLGGGLRFF